MTEIQFRQAYVNEAEALAELRVSAMKPSLEAVGRFDPDRARQRFLSTFVAENTCLILKDGELAGFYVVRQKTDHLWFDHLYLAPHFQRQGLGKKVIEQVQSQAEAAELPVRLMALIGSPANDFYLSLGFEQVKQDAYDNYYCWQAAAGSS